MPRAVANSNNPAIARLMHCGTWNKKLEAVTMIDSCLLKFSYVKRIDAYSCSPGVGYITERSLQNEYTEKIASINQLL